MTTQRIYHMDGTTVLFECEAETQRDAILAAVAKKANLIGSNLSGSDLSGSDLSYSDLSYSNLRNSDLIGSDLSYSNLIGSNLIGSDLSSSDLSYSNLSGSNLSGSNLSGSNLSGSDLSYSNLRGSNLRGSNLSGSNLSGSDLRGSNLSGSILRGSIIDAGHDRRGYRFWAWRHTDGHVVYRGGCREWQSIDDANAHFGLDYDSDGDVAECLARVAFLTGEAERRGWATVSVTDGVPLPVAEAAS